MSIKIEVKGGTTEERNVMAAVVGKALREKGFDGVKTTNVDGIIFPHRILESALTIFDMVANTKPSLFREEISVSALSFQLPNAYESRWLNEDGENERTLHFNKNAAVNDIVVKSGGIGSVTELYAGEVTHYHDAQGFIKFQEGLIDGMQRDIENIADIVRQRNLKGGTE